MISVNSKSESSFGLGGQAAVSFSGTRIAGTLIVLAHLAVLVVHGSGHTHLSIKPNAWQTAFIAIIIFAGPLVGVVLLWTRLQRMALSLIATTMAGALVFGLYYHFVTPGADNALGLAPGQWRTVFVATSVLLSAIEALGCAWSLAVRRRRRAYAAGQRR